MSTELTKLARLVAEFERLDASILEALRARELAVIFQAILQAIEAKKEIKRFLSQHKPISIGPEFATKLKKIRDNYGYTVDHVLDKLASETGEILSQEDEEDIDYVEALFSEGTATYVDENFFRRQNEAAAIIVGQSLPDIFVNHLVRLRESYSLGLFEATIIYCRAVIESGCFEALRRRGKININSKTRDMREYSLKALMRDIKSLVYKTNWEAADKVIKRADDVLHSKRENVVVSEREAYDAIKSTYALVEELFK